MSSEFMRALESGNFESVSDLENKLIKSASFWQQTLISPYHDAAARGNLPGIKDLVEGEYKIPLTTIDNARNTALHWSAGAGHMDVVLYLLAKAEEAQIKDIFMNAKNALGDTAIHRAAWRQQVEIVRCLLNEGADITIRNIMGQLPIDLIKNNTELGCILQRCTVSRVEFSSGNEDGDEDDDSFEINLSDTEYSSEDDECAELLVAKRFEQLFIPPSESETAPTTTNEEISAPTDAPNTEPTGESLDGNDMPDLMDDPEEN